MNPFRTDIPVEEAWDILLNLPLARRTERVPLDGALGRVLCEDILSPEMVPPFDRSPFDGYALRGADTASASREHPVTLSITEEIPAGSAPTLPVDPGQAAKILTGAPMPAGADATVKYEITEFTDSTVTFFEPVKPGSNVVPAGEDIRTGDLVAAAGTAITPPVLGLLASLGISSVPVFARPRAALISTGSELLPVEAPLAPGKIRNSSRYTLGAYLQQAGVLLCGAETVPDDTASIAAAIGKAFETVDVVLTTGGISVGDYDLVQKAAEALGAQILFWKLQMKPGAALMAATLDGKLLLSLSGNPASAALALHLIALPCLRRYAGLSRVLPETISVTTLAPFKKPSPNRRFVRGRLVVEDGKACFAQTGDQGNGVLSSLIGCDLLGEIPAGSPPLPAGSILTAYRI